MQLPRTDVRSNLMRGRHLSVLLWGEYILMKVFFLRRRVSRSIAPSSPAQLEKWPLCYSDHQFLPNLGSIPLRHGKYSTLGHDTM